MRKITKRSAAIMTGAVVAVGGAGAAWAAWLSTGTGSVTATAGSAQNLQIQGFEGAAAPAVVGPVLPGNPADVTFRIRNPNAYAVSINSVTIKDFAATASTAVACSVGDTFAYNSAAVLGPPVTSIAANSSVDLVWDNAIRLTSNPDNDCQGQPFKFTIEASAQSAAG